MSENTIAPVQPGQRIEEIDIVRGLALLGILMVNMSYFKYPLYLDRYPSSFSPGIDQFSAWLIQLLFTGKFYAIFSFLFGLGFYIFMERTLGKGFEQVPLYRRRLFALLAFGLLHLALLWSGDILFTYALGGFLLPAFRHQPLESIRKWIAGLFLVALVIRGALAASKGVSEVLGGDEYKTYMEEMVRSAMAMYTGGRFFELAAFRAVNELPYVAIGVILWMPAMLAFFLCGLYAGTY